MPQGRNAKGCAARLQTDGSLFAAALETIYLSATAPSHWPQALGAMARCFGDVGAVLLYIRSDGSFGTIVSPELEAAQQDYEQHWGAQDIRAMRAFPALHQRETLTDRHIMSEAEIRRHPIYCDFLIPHGLGWFGAVRMLPDPKIMVLISVQRWIKKPAFSDEELDVLARLGKHAEHSLRLSVRLMNAEVVNAGLQDALGRIGAGVIALDCDRSIVFANAPAARHINEAFAIVGGRLRPRFESDRAAFELALDAAAGADAPDTRPILLQQVQSRHALVAYALPVPRIHDESVDHMFSLAKSIVLLIDPDDARQPDAAVVRDLLGLTLGEARVAALVGSGMAPKEAAQQLGLTEETTRTTLKRVFAKVGVSRQSELAALLTRLVLR
jgi:DNA-binding CsgD family transcriptional regulator